MEFLDLLALVSFIFICINGFGIFRNWLSNPQKPPPGPVGLPILGSLIQVGDRPHESLATIAKVHGPLMTVRLGFVTTIVVSSAEMAREILQKHDATFSGRPIPDAVRGEAQFELSMVWQSAGPTWRNLRKICTTQMFTTQRLDAYQSLRNERMKGLINILDEHSLANQAVNIGRLAFATTLNLVSNAVFSRDLVDPKSEGAQEFRDVVWGVMKYVGKPNVSDFFPLIKAFDVQGIRRHAKASYDHLLRIVDDLIDERLQWRSSGSPRWNDFLDVLLDNAEEEGSNLDRGYIKLLITDLYIAGGDTSAATTEWVMAELLRHPEAMAQVQQELLEVVGPGREVKESDIPQLPYLQAAVKESMRLHPTAPLLLPHKSETDVEVCGYMIPKHTQVLVNVYAIGRDEAYWENAESFKPERFIESKADFRGKDWGLIPFGAGRRICPGLPLAVRMVHLMLATLLNTFDWRLQDGVSAKTLDMKDKVGVTLQLKSPLLAIPCRRLVNTSGS